MTANFALHNLQRHLGLALSTAALSLLTMTAVAATTLEKDCPKYGDLDRLEVATVAAPGLRLEAADRDGIEASEAARTDDAPSAEPQPAPAITSSNILNDLLADEDANDQSVDGVDEQPPELPPTVTRLPGIADEDLSRFRRQMFRTDI